VQALRVEVALEALERFSEQRRAVGSVAAAEAGEQRRLISRPLQRERAVRRHDAALLCERLGGELAREAEVQVGVPAAAELISRAEHEEQVCCVERVDAREVARLARAGEDVERQALLDGLRDAGARRVLDLGATTGLGDAAVGEVRERDGAEAGRRAAEVPSVEHAPQ
jgi:hypothetical protein